MAEDLPQKIADAKIQIAAGNVSNPSDLSVHAAEKVVSVDKQVQGLTGFWALISTPAGLTACTALIAAIGAVITPMFSGAALPDKTIKVELVKWPEDLRVVASQEPAVQLPVVAKPFGIVTFSAKVPPLDKAFWDKYRAKGYRIDHYGNEGQEIQDWAALIQKSGGYPCVIITDTKNYLGGGPLVDAEKTAALISKYEKGNTP